MSAYILSAILSIAIFETTMMYIGMVLTEVFHYDVIYSVALPIVTTIISIVGFPLLLNKIFNQVTNRVKEHPISKFFKNSNIDISIWETDFPTLLQYKLPFSKRQFIISSSLIELLTDSEMQLLIDREQKKNRSGYLLIMQLLAFLPFCFRHITNFLYITGIKHKAVGGAGSIASFAYALGKISQFCHIINCFFYREFNIYANRTMPQSYFTELLPKLEREREKHFPPTPISELIHSLNMADITDSSYTIKKVREYQKGNSEDQFRQEYYALFHCRKDIESEALGEKKKSALRVGEWLFVLIPISALSSLIMTIVGFVPWLPLLFLGISLIATQIQLLPLKKWEFETIPAEILPLQSFRTELEGELEVYDPTISYEYKFYLKGQDWKIPLDTGAMSLPTGDEGDRYKVTGWLRNGEERYLKVEKISLDRRELYNYSPIMTAIIADFLILALSIILIFFTFREG